MSCKATRFYFLVNLAKMVEPIEMLFGLRTQVVPRNHVLDGVNIPPIGRGNFEGKGQFIVRWQKWLNRSIFRLGCGLG